MKKCARCKQGNVILLIRIAIISLEAMKNYSFSIVVAAIILMNAADSSLASIGDKTCIPSVFDKDTLQDPCKMDINYERPPSHYSIVFPTQYGSFKADCVRERAPVWSDRVYRLAKNG